MSVFRRCCPACFFALLLAAAQVAAQPSQNIPAGARGAQPVVTEEDIERARRRHRMPDDAELAGVPVPVAPNVDALPAPTVRTPPDLEAIAKGYAALGEANGPPAAVGPRLLVFVSFAMPEPSLARLVDQAARAGATLYLRGLVDGSLRQTVMRSQRLIAGRQVALQVDPRPFDRFSIAATPAFVLVREEAATQDCLADHCAAQAGFASVAGDVSLDYALEYFARTAPRLSAEAAFFLQKLKG